MFQSRIGLRPRRRRSLLVAGIVAAVMATSGRALPPCRAVGVGRDGTVGGMDRCRCLDMERSSACPRCISWRRWRPRGGRTTGQAHLEIRIPGEGGDVVVRLCDRPGPGLSFYGFVHGRPVYGQVHREGTPAASPVPLAPPLSGGLRVVG